MRVVCLYAAPIPDAGGAVAVTHSGVATFHKCVFTGNTAARTYPVGTIACLDGRLMVMSVISPFNLLFARCSGRLCICVCMCVYVCMCLYVLVSN